MKKLIVRLKGGLGNQLFCYATARRLALKNNAELVLDDITGFKYDHLYKRQYALKLFNIRSRFATPAEMREPFGRVRRMILKKASERRPLAHRHYIEQLGIDFNPDILDLQLQEGYTYFDGFGQSEQYFQDVEEIIREDLVISTPRDKDNLAMRQQILDASSVAIHVRWFDAEDIAELSNNMTLAYYEQAINLIRKSVPDLKLFIFSDKPEKSSRLLGPLIQHIPHAVVNHNIVLGDEVADLWLMSHCRHFVIGNSTFSWWGAWLGERKGLSIIVAPGLKIDPKAHVTAWGFPHLIPARWYSL